MSDEEREQWITERIAAMREHLRELFANSPDAFWETIDSAVAYIVMGCADLDDFDWPANLHLGDVVDKHLVQGLYDAKQERDARL